MPQILELTPLLKYAPSLNQRPSYWTKFKKRFPSNKRPLPSPCFMEEYRDNSGCVVLVVLNHKQVIIDSFKNCGLTIVTDATENLLNLVEQVKRATIFLRLSEGQHIYYRKR